VLGGQAVLVKGFTSKSGKKFDARLVADKERGVAFDFGK
ncbi:topoisomerase C-terminal repeat-containing protein, partial [Bifidobacterium adolescentis]